MIVSETKTITLKEFPAIKSFLKRSFPGYRKHKVNVVIGECLSVGPAYWDGGSKTNTDAVSPGGLPASVNTPFVFGAKATYKPAMVPEQGMLVESGTFCGRTSMLRVVIRYDDQKHFGLA